MSEFYRRPPVNTDIRPARSEQSVEKNESKSRRLLKMIAENFGTDSFSDSELDELVNAHAGERSRADTYSERQIQLLVKDGLLEKNPRRIRKENKNRPNEHLGSYAWVQGDEVQFGRNRLILFLFFRPDRRGRSA